MIAKNIKKFRESKHFSQEKLAELLHYKQQQVSNWERGLRTPSIDDLLSIAEALEVPVGDLLFENYGLDWYECTYDEKEKKYIFKIDNTKQLLKDCESEDSFAQNFAKFYLKMKGGKSFYSIHLSEYECYFYYNLLTKGARLNVGDFIDIFNAGMLHMRKELEYKQQLVPKGKKMLRRMAKYRNNND